MAEITAALVKVLRDKTGAGMMDCKRALAETDGDIEQAVDWLRTKGLAAAARKAGRVTAEGLVGIAAAPLRAAMVEVNAETDFVARNDGFQDFVAAVAQIALDVGEHIDTIRAAPFPNTDRSVGDQLTHLVATIGENLTLRRARVIALKRGVVSTYVHQPLRPRLGRIGVIVGIEAPGELEALELLGRQMGMQVAASRAQSIEIAGIDPATLEREKAIFREQARDSGKSDAVIEKMVQGRIRKFYEEAALLEQLWVHDGESRVKAVLAKAGARVAAFARFQLGEGIEKPPAG